MQKLLEVFMEHTPQEIRNELAQYSSNNNFRGPALPKEVCEYLQSIGIFDGYIEYEKNFPKNDGFAIFGAAMSIINPFSK